MLMDRTETETEVLYQITGSLSGMPDSAPRFFNQISNDLQTIKKNIVFDFQKLMFIDSMAIGLLVGIIIKAKQLNLAVHIRNPQPLIRDILEATQLKKMFTDLY